MFASLVFLLSVGVSVALIGWNSGSYGYCTMIVKGLRTSREIRLPVIEIPPNAEDVYFHVIDKCTEFGNELFGCVIVACDPDTTPSVTMHQRGVGAAVFHRHGRVYLPAYIYIEQYCA